MNLADVKGLLDEMADRYNRPEFIQDDPVSIPHCFTTREDIEISGFLTALFSWGNRKGILRSAGRLMDLMDVSPGAFIREAGAADLARLEKFVHRTMNGTDMKALILALRDIYLHHGGLEVVMAASPGETDTFPSITRLRFHFLPLIPDRTRKHLANPETGASAKRIHMFLRWMVRTDRRGVDFGIWKTISPAQLVLPLDVHTGTVARELGILTRKQNDRKAVMEVTDILRTFDPQDPVRYDFALFGFGTDRRWKQS